MASLLTGLALGAGACSEPMPGEGEPTEVAWVEGALSEEAVLRGLDPEEPKNPTANGGVVLEDFDLDGDLDVLLYRSARWAWLYRNTGGGYFEPAGGLPPLDDRALRAVGVADFDGDGVLDLLACQTGLVSLARGIGPFSWATPEPLLEGGQVGPAFSTAAFGDVDADGDTDVFVAALQTVEPQGPIEGKPEPAVPYPEVLLLNEGGSFVEGQRLEPYGRPHFVQIASFVDLERDGDLDVWAPSEFGGLPGADPTAMYINEGGQLVNRAEELGLNADVSGMGLDFADLDGDGQLDLYVIQVGKARLFLSGSDWAEAAQARGLHLDDGDHSWSGWSAEFADVDNDGWVDAFVAGGSNDPGLQEGQIDRFLRGQPDGRFVDASVELGPGTDAHHFGLAAGDVDGDGRLDALAFGPTGAPQLWMSAGDGGGWLEVELEGPAGAPEAFGAQLSVEAGGRRQVRQVNGLRAVGQGPRRVHFGLGEAELVDRVTVLWPGGATSEVRDVEPGQRLVLQHP